MWRPTFALVLLTLTGCARETMWIVAGPTGAPMAGMSNGSRGALSRWIPSGEGCLQQLSSAGIQYRLLPPKRGMTTPVRIEGPLGGVRFQTAGETSIVCDCRLVVALHSVAPQLRALGVTEVQHSGAYVFRTQRNGKPSLHARGLAIDLHGVAIDGETLMVESSYRRGLAHACTPSGSPINEMTCRLGQSGLFKELITPDDDRDHRDHVHLAIAPL